MWNEICFLEMESKMMNVSSWFKSRNKQSVSIRPLHLPLLRNLLKLMPVHIQQRETIRFSGFRANVEFATWLSRPQVETVVREFVKKGFRVWTNIDRKTAFLYGAGIVPIEEQEKLLRWLRFITVSGNWGHVVFHDDSSQGRLVRFQSMLSRQ